MSSIRKMVGKTGVTWRADYHDPQGRRIRKTFNLKRDAEAFLSKVTVSKKEGRYEEIFDIKKETKTTFNELADKYEELYGQQKSWEKKRHLVKIARDYFGETLLSKISYFDLENYRNRRRETPTWKGTPRCTATVNREIAAVSVIFSKGVEWGFLENSPMKKGRRLISKENNQRLRFLTEEEIASLINACLPHLRPIVEVALMTGMRRGEILGLKWEAIRNGFIYLTETKANKSRQIPVNDTLAEVLREIRQTNQLKSEFVFCDSRGRRFGDIKKSFHAACRRAGISDFHFHDLRHTFASTLVMKGVSLKAVQELLGHASLTMTMRYSHLSQAHLQEAVSVLNFGRETRGVQNG